MTTNIVVAAFGADKLVRTRALYQWDYGQILQFSGLDLPSTYTVHFSNVGVGGTAKTMLGGADGVDIPDEYLTTGKPVYAWVYLHAGNADGETVYAVIIPVIARPQPVEEEPTPVQQGLIEQALTLLNAGVEAADVAVQSATLAESWAVGGTGTRPGEDTDNAKHYAEVAQQGAEEAGYAWFDIDDQTGEMMITITDNLDEDVTFEVNETTGELEVTINE